MSVARKDKTTGEGRVMIERGYVNKMPPRRHNEIEKWWYMNARKSTAS